MVFLSRTAGRMTRPSQIELSKLAIMRNNIAIQRFANLRKMQIGGSTCRDPNSFSLRYCLRLLSARLPSPREAEVGEVEAGAVAVQVPPVAVLLVPVALGPIAGAELAEDRIRADRLLTAVRKIRRRQAAVPILGLLVPQPRRPTPRAGNSTIHETSTIRIIPLIQSGQRVEWDFRPGRLYNGEANRTARGRPVLQWFWSITVLGPDGPRLHRGMRGRSRPHNLPFCPTQTGWSRASAIL